MAVVCSRCSALHESPESCPRCGAAVPADLGGTSAARWQHTPWGRLLLALGLSQGLFYALRQLLLGVLMGVEGGSAVTVATSLHGAALLQAAQLLALFLGGLLAGGGQRAGVFLGAILGASNAAVAILINGPTPGASLLAQAGGPLIQAMVGALAGGLGSFIWAPMQEAVAPGLTGGARKPARKPRPSPFAGRVAWFRVLLGAALAVGGTLSAAFLFDKLLTLGGGKLGTASESYDVVITWEIRALSLVLGGAFAGACTLNGPKQGLVVGFFATLVLIAFETRGQVAWLELALLTPVGCFPLTVTGGWFGSQLFPPVVKTPRSRHIGSASLA